MSDSNLGQIVTGKKIENSDISGLEQQGFKKSRYGQEITDFLFRKDKQFIRT